MKHVAEIRTLIAGACLISLAACTPNDEPVHLGYIEADWTYVAAPAAGRIVEQPVKEGDRVDAPHGQDRYPETTQ